jgi:transcriptional regulator with XRE-family HTH domain
MKCFEESEFDERVGRRIMHRRILLGLTQQDLAEKVGVTFQQIHKYEHGTNRLSAFRLKRIAEALITTIGYLVGETEVASRGGGSPPPRHLGEPRSFAPEAAAAA